MLFPNWSETANQSECENKDLMLLMSTQKDETAVQHYIFNRTCQTPYRYYFETKQNCKHFYSFLESVNFIGGPFEGCRDKHPEPSLHLF